MTRPSLPADENACPAAWQAELSWLERLPKVELHLHLEGAIPLPTLWVLISADGGDPEVPDLAALERRFRYRDFAHFLATWGWKNRFLRTLDDFTLIAEAVAADLARQRILYAEVYFSHPDFAGHGLEPQPLAAAIRTGIDRVQGTEVALIADLVRDCGPESAERTLSAVAEVRGLGVVGVGLGGSEPQYPPEPFATVFAHARRLGLRTTAHAGEAAGAESVWGALRALGVERIGHGTRAVEDDALVDYLAEHRVPVEMCPLSNVRTGVVQSIADHPIRRLFDRGLLVSVNSDDPQLFDTSLAGELLLLRRHLGFTRSEVRSLLLQGVEGSWLSPARKAALAAAFRADPAWSEEP